MAFPAAKLEIAFGNDPTASYYDLAQYNPLVYYRLDETSGTVATDASGNGRTGTYGTAAAAVTGALPADPNKGNATTALTIADAASLRLSRSACTIVMWFKWSGSGSGAKALRDHAVNTGRILLKVNVSTGDFVLNYEGSDVTTWSAVFDRDTSWHMVALTINANNPTLYYDGERNTSATTLGGASSEAAGLTYIGTDNGGALAFDGDLDEFSEYNVALLPSRIVAMYAARDTNPTVSWTDVSQYLLGWSATRGRQHELDSIQAGTASFRLANTNRVFDPTYTAGPYYGNLLPMRRVRLTLTYNAVDYVKFTGYIEQFPLVWEGPNWAYVDVTAIDGFALLAQANISDWGWTAELAGARISHILDAAAWPDDLRAVDTGTATMLATTFDATTFEAALGSAQEAADADLGYFFVSADGLATYHDRTHRLYYSTTAATFGDQEGQKRYINLIPDYSLDHVVNDVTTTATGGTPQQEQDGPSQRQFFRRTLQREVPVSTDVEAHIQTMLILDPRAQPAFRIQSAEMIPTTDAEWAQILNVEIGDRYTFVRTPPGGGDAISIDCYVEQISDSSERSLSWGTQWQLSPVAAGLQPWELDNPRSILDWTTYLA